jgi:hypothetical protein
MRPGFAFESVPAVLYHSVRAPEAHSHPAATVALTLAVGDERLVAALDASVKSAAAPRVLDPRTVQLAVAASDGEPVLQWCDTLQRRRPVDAPKFYAEWHAATKLLTLHVTRNMVPLSSRAGHGPLVFVVWVGDTAAVSPPFFCFTKQETASTSRKRRPRVFHTDVADGCALAARAKAAVVCSDCK